MVFFYFGVGFLKFSVGKSLRKIGFEGSSDDGTPAAGVMQRLAASIQKAKRISFALVMHKFGAWFSLHF